VTGFAAAWHDVGRWVFAVVFVLVVVAGVAITQ
jgi:hypothetical protein